MIRMVRRVARTALRSRVVNAAVRRLARCRGHRLVLVYHRVGEPSAPGCEVVPCVPPDLFRAHLQALGEVLDLVDIDELLASDDRRAGQRPAMAVTFDDDLTSHACEALPVLQAMNVPAVFFLSGRALHGLGPYWFQQLELLLGIHGAAGTAALLGLDDATPGEHLVRKCERDGAMRRRLDALVPPTEARTLQRADVAALATAGMTVGFHTVDHRLLPDMDDADLEDAVSRGRPQLAAAAGAPVRYFAYPYGKSDARVASAVERAGFDAAFAGHPAPVHRGADRYCLGRWEPGPLPVEDLLVQLSVRLHRASPSSAS